jgi:hypothetical protein
VTVLRSFVAVKQLTAVRFVLAERRGTAAFYRINEACVSCFPTAADVVIGRPAPVAPQVPCGA